MATEGVPSCVQSNIPQAGLFAVVKSASYHFHSTKCARYIATGHSPSRFVSGLDFFLFNFFDLCSGTAAFFFEEPPFVAAFFDTGVSAAGAMAEESASAAERVEAGISSGSLSASPFNFGASSNDDQYADVQHLFMRVF